MVQFDFTQARMYTFDDDVWLVDDLAEADIAEEAVTVRLNGRPVTLHRTGAGFFEGHDGRFGYRGVVGRTETHVTVTGNWDEDGAQGPFVIVVPMTVH